MKPKRRSILLVAVALAAIVLVATHAPEARSDDSHEKQVKDAAAQSARAAKAFEAIMQVPDKAIPRDLVARAKAIAVFPQVIKVAFTVGGEGGRGVVSQHAGTGWGNPVFLRAGGGSVGPQIGASSTDFFLLLMNDESVEGLMKDKFELGGEAGVAAGPVGRNAGAATDALMNAAVLPYSRSRGLFAGLNVKGIVLRPEDGLIDERMRQLGGTVRRRTWSAVRDDKWFDDRSLYPCDGYLSPYDYYLYPYEYVPPYSPWRA